MQTAGGPFGGGGTVHGGGANLCEDVDCSSLVTYRKMVCVGGGARCSWVGRHETSIELMLTAMILWQSRAIN